MTSTPMASTRHWSSTPARESPVREVADDESTEQACRAAAPRPPNRLVPPMTTAVIDSRLASAAAFGLARAGAADEDPRGDAVDQRRPARRR